jgi:hypothetical protein
VVPGRKKWGFPALLNGGFGLVEKEGKEMPVYVVYSDGCGSCVIDTDLKSIADESMYHEIVKGRMGLFYPVEEIEALMEGRAIEKEVDDPKLYKRFAKILGAREENIAIYELILPDEDEDEEDYDEEDYDEDEEDY